MLKNNFRVFIAIVVLIGMFSLFTGMPGVAEKSVHAADSSEDSAQYVAYYFYNSKRCSSCYRIENWSESAIQENFKQELSDGKLKWRAINIEKDEHKHFIQDFNLYSKSLVIVERDNGENERSKKLKKVWQLVGDKERFFDYVTSEMRDFMEKS